MGNPWGIAALLFALVIIWCLIRITSNKKFHDPAPTSTKPELPPDNSNCRSTIWPRESEWFNGRDYVPGSPGLYKAKKFIQPGVMSDGSHCDASEFKFMLVWTGSRWVTQSGDQFDELYFAFRGLTEKVPT